MQPKLCAAGVQLRDQVDTWFPNSRTASDGWVGDSRHSARKSDHNPDKFGWVRAVDIDSSIANAMDQQGLLAKYGLGRPVPNDPVHLELAKGMAEGGIASGPTSGYQANLQGTNAVVPLPSGQQIPVDMPEFNTNLTDQTQILSQQLAKLDDLVRVMQTQVGVSTKILQSAN